MAESVPSHASMDDRGRTHISERAVEKLSRAAALEVPGVIKHDGRFSQLGKGLPKVSATVAGTRAVLSLDIATAWPLPVARVSARVRDHVIERVETLTAMSVDKANVTVAHVSVDSEPKARVR